MRRTHRAAAGLAVLLLAACGGTTNPDQPSADERKAIDDIARKADQEQQDQTFDTSADSLVLNESVAEPAGEANAVTANVVAAPDAAANSAAPR